MWEWVLGRWVDFNRCDFGGQRHGQWMQQRGSGGATTWVVGVAARVWFLTVDCGVFFIFLVVLMINYGLLVVVVVVVVSGVCSIAVVVIVVLE